VFVRVYVWRKFSGRFLQRTHKIVFFGNRHGGTGCFGCTRAPRVYVMLPPVGVPRGIQGYTGVYQGGTHLPGTLLSAEFGCFLLFWLFSGFWRLVAWKARAWRPYYRCSRVIRGVRIQTARGTPRSGSWRDLWPGRMPRAVRILTPRIRSNLVGPWGSLLPTGGGASFGVRAAE